jgi:hypothetical protein
MSVSAPVLLSTAYLPPVQYVSKFTGGNPVFIEQYENYQKQSYRNRCCIYGANGILCLVIPVIKHHGEKTPVKTVAIDYGSPWQKIHLKSIESAYRLSPFYEYYADEIATLYCRKPALLFDWNLMLLNQVLEWLSIRTLPYTTSCYEKNTGVASDFRACIHPKARHVHPDPSFRPVPYPQVFQERHGFIPNLSIIDLLFNEGPKAGEVVRESVILSY